MPYRDNVDALAARHAALSTEVRRSRAELIETQRLLVQARARTKLAVLDNISIASPCSASWKDMIGDERVRACAACQKNVYNISDMTRAEAEALILAKEGRLCLRYWQRKDGTILLKDCMITIDRRGHRAWVALGAAALVAGGALAAQENASVPEPWPAELTSVRSDWMPIDRRWESSVGGFPGFSSTSSSTPHLPTVKTPLDGDDWPNNKPEAFRAQENDPRMFELARMFELERQGELKRQP